MWNILLVDDDVKIHATLAHACAALARVLPVRTARRAAQFLNEHPIDLVILEQRLSDGSGLSLLGSIKAQQPRLPVIMGTAYGSERVCAAALKLGVRDYFIKPWVASEMVESIEAILATTRDRSETRRNVVAEQVGRAVTLPSLNDGIEPAIREAGQRIAEQRWDPDSFSCLARNLGLSKSALSRRFSQTFNISYRRLLQESRMARARELLRGSSLTISEIAQHVGFGDLPRFDKVFKAAVGTPPSLYRQQQQTRTPQQATSQSR